MSRKPTYTETLVRVDTKLESLNTKVDTLIAHDYDHEGRLSKVEGRTGNGLSGRQKIGYGSGGVAGVVAVVYGTVEVLKALGWL